jgi:predicted kinase
LIILICGYPGVGKTMLANELAHYLDAVALSSDKVRKELFGKPNYTENEKSLVYNILLLISKYLYNAGINCILDATFNSQRSREDVKKRLKLDNDQYKIIECICPEDLIISRIQKRKKDYSDADLSVYRMIKEIYEPVKENHITVDTSVCLKKMIPEVVKKIVHNHEL